jgi:predicted S18 family serine protease
VAVKPSMVLPRPPFSPTLTDRSDSTKGGRSHSVTPDGLIGPVGGIPLKVAAASQARLRMVLVPEKQETAEGNWEVPSSMQVSQVDSVSQAYQALTSPQSSIASSFLLVSDGQRYLTWSRSHSTIRLLQTPSCFQGRSHAIDFLRRIRQDL